MDKVTHHVVDKLYVRPSTKTLRMHIQIKDENGFTVNLYLDKRVEEELRRKIAETGS